MQMSKEQLAKAAGANSFLAVCFFWFLEWFVPEDSGAYAALQHAQAFICLVAIIAFIALLKRYWDEYDDFDDYQP